MGQSERSCWMDTLHYSTLHVRGKSEIKYSFNMWSRYEIAIFFTWCMFAKWGVVFNMWRKTTVDCLIILSIMGRDKIRRGISWRRFLSWGVLTNPFLNCLIWHGWVTYQTCPLIKTHSSSLFRMLLWARSCCCLEIALTGWRRRCKPCKFHTRCNQ